MTILVTGARGNIGGRVVAALAKAGHHVRAFEGRYEDDATVHRNFDGADAALFVTVGPQLARYDATLAAAAKAAGTQRVVKLSIYAAGEGGSELRDWHKAGEDHVVDAGLAWTFLRPGPFASNALRWLPSLRAAGKAYGAFGNAALPLVHPDDIADVAALALTTPGHEAEIYELTGPESLTAAQQVASLGELVGKSFVYIDLGDDAALRGMIDAGMPSGAATAMLHLVQALRAKPPQVNDVVARLLGQPARTFRQWALANSEAFR